MKFWDKDYLSEDGRACFILLDTLDLKKFLKKFKDKELYELMDYLEEKYSLENGHFLFNGVNEFEFSNYINVRYNKSCILKMVRYEIKWKE